MFDRLRKDHRRIALLADWLEAMIRDAAAPPADLEEMRTALTREVLQHIVAEENRLFRPLRQAAPDWLESACPRHHGGDAFARFVEDHGTYWTAARITAGWADYRIAARALLAELRTRIAHEESHIFPHAQARLLAGIETAR